MFSSKKLLIIFEILAIVTLLEINVYLTKSRTKKPETIVKTSAQTSFGELLTFDVPHPQVLAAATTVPAKTPPPSTIPNKKTYIIAAIGDSMVDTMGDSLEYLQKNMRAKYPKTNLVFYNYGIGSENIEMALARFDKPFNNGSRHYGPLRELHADVIILGSWSYNPLIPYDRDKHWSYLSDMVNKAKATGAKVYMLAEIAPLKSGFGKGPGGVNWPDEAANLQAAHIIEQLENTVGLAKTLGIPLVDAFDSSKSEGNYGRGDLVNSYDGIHPSIAGHQFIANLIAKTIILP